MKTGLLGNRKWRQRLTPWQEADWSFESACPRSVVIGNDDVDEESDRRVVRVVQTSGRQGRALKGQHNRVFTPSSLPNSYARVVVIRKIFYTSFEAKTLFTSQSYQLLRES